MKKESKLIVQALKENNVRTFLGILNECKKEDIERIDDQTGLNLIHYCAQEDKSSELSLVLSYVSEINLNLKSHGLVQKTALDIAFSMGNVEVSKVLIKNGANLSDPKKAKKLFRADPQFGEIVDEAIAKNLPTKKKKVFFSFL